jgi:hypothetical protein
MLLAEYTFLDVVWTMFIFFGWLMFVMLACLLLFDNFRRRDHSGWAKAGWTLLIICLPLIGAMVYMIARPHSDELAWDSPAGLPVAGAER